MMLLEEVSDHSDFSLKLFTTMTIFEHSRNAIEASSS